MSILFNDEEFKIASSCPECFDCVAVAHKDGTIAIRDTKDNHKTTLQFTKSEWQAFIDGIKKGEFDF